MGNKKSIKILFSVWSPFYSPAFLAGRLLQERQIDVTYDTVTETERYQRIKDNKSNTVVAAAVSLHWESCDDDREGIYHFAQINSCDGFFLVGRKPCKKFDWSQLISKKILVSGRQPITALQYAIKRHLAASGMKTEPADNGSQIFIFSEKGSVDEILQDFRNGKGDFAHVQGHWAQQLVDEDKNRFLEPVWQTPLTRYSFSSLMASNELFGGKLYRDFMKAYNEALKFVNTKSAGEVVDKIGCLFSCVEPEILRSSIEQYQNVGCWKHDGKISKELYCQTKEIFMDVGKDFKDLPYEDVVKTQSFDSTTINAKITKPEVKRLVREWFQNLDDYRTDAGKLNALVTESLKIETPEEALPFETWCQSITRFKNPTHDVKALEIEIDFDVANIKLVVRWERSDSEAENPEKREAFYAAQTWTIIRSEQDKKLRIATYKVDYLIDEVDLRGNTGK
ncbi:hypothetical protein D1AOALGA4SA_8410 [Olavius algarvensis Delta 1 endosymbiont]|nr:hypothetical protein D1AOALGA4SA_8410 [Olavius algarvensis Delta 1 endosymbiont]